MFHEDRGDLHGITVAVDLNDGALWVGRCDTDVGPEVVLRDADVHRASDEMSREEYLQRALNLGVWPNHPIVALSKETVRSIRRLAELDG